MYCQWAYTKPTTRALSMPVSNTWRVVCLEIRHHRECVGVSCRHHNNALEYDPTTRTWIGRLEQHKELQHPRSRAAGPFRKDLTLSPSVPSKYAGPWKTGRLEGRTMMVQYNNNTPSPQAFKATHISMSRGSSMTLVNFILLFYTVKKVF